MVNYPLFSIVIPTHNSQNTIVNLLLSINNSRFDNFSDLEVVVVDDGSKDNTLAVIDELTSQLKFNLKVYPLKKNVGPAKTRNFGVKKAHGLYILFLDSDVILFKNTLNHVYKEVKQAKYRAFTGIWHYRQKTKKFFPQFKALRDWTYWFVEREKNFRYYLFSTRIACIEKKLFNQIGGFDTKFKQATVEDIELTYRIEQRVKIKFCPNFLVHHEFEDFWPIAIKYFKRSQDWIQLYQKRLKFDPVATSKKEAKKSICGGIFFIFLGLSIINIIFLYPALVFFIIFNLLELRFWSFLVKKKGYVFLLKSILVSLILYLFIDAGAAWGYLQSIFF